MHHLSRLVVGLLLVSAVNAFAVDDRGNTATQGADTWVRAAQSMLPKPQYANGQLTLVAPIKIEVSQSDGSGGPAVPLCRPVVPHAQSHAVLRPDRGDDRFSAKPFSATPGMGRSCAARSASKAPRWTRLDTLVSSRSPGETPTYFGGLTQDEVVGPNGLKRLGIDTAEPIVTSVLLLDAAQYVNNGLALAPGYAITQADLENILAAQGTSQIAALKQATWCSSTPGTGRHG